MARPKAFSAGSVQGGLVVTEILTAGACAGGAFVTDVVAECSIGVSRTRFWVAWGVFTAVLG